MDINQEVSLNTELPLQSVQDFELHWGRNEHAKFKLKGLMKSDCGDAAWRRDYVGSELAVTLDKSLDESGDGALFRGIIQEVKLYREHGIGLIQLEASSASVQLDDDSRRLCRSFQNTGLTYPEIARKMAEIGGGQVICTTEDKKIDAPLLCYQETVWEFLKRLASRQNSFLIPDIKTGRPNLWFGMRFGKQIKADLSDWQTEILIHKKYDKNGTGKAVRNYFIECRTLYALGDWIMNQGEKCIICAVDARLRQGEITFSYRLASERDMKKKPFYNEALTGLSLWGTVAEAEKETVRITFDVDGEEGSWFYPWRPETGNALYAMPEVGAKAAVYFMNHDEGSGIAVRCPGQAPGREGTGNQEPEDKSMTTPAKGEAELFAGNLTIRKDEDRMDMHDASGISFSGGKVEIEADGKVKLRAREILLSAVSEIKATTE